MRLQFLLALAFVSVSLFSACDSTASENEPNNSPEKAQPVELPSVIEASLEDSADLDYFQFEIPDRRMMNKALRVEVSHKRSADLEIIIARDGKVIKSIDDYACKKADSGRKPVPLKEEAREGFANLALQPGKYLISVRLADRKKSKVPAAYTLSLQLEVRTGFAEIEPNDTRQSANTLEAGTAVEGFFSPGSQRKGKKPEVDWYSVEIASSNRVLMNIELSGVPGVDSILELYDKRGNLLRKSGDGRVHLGEKISRFGLPGAGTYYIAVKSARLYMANLSIPYSLLVTLDEFQEGNELEPNDSVREANPAHFEQDISAYLDPASDRDFYRFVIPQPGTYMYSASVKGVAGVDFGLALYDRKGRLLRRFNAAGPGEAEHIVNYGIRAEKYEEQFYICVFSESGASSREQYSLHMTMYQSGTQGEIEPNDTKERNNRVRIGVDKRGFLYPQGDKDYFSFSLDEDQRVRITVSGVTSVDSRLRVFDEAGKQLHIVNGNGRHKGEVLEASLKGGRKYLVLVETVSGSANNPREPYTLRINPLAGQDE